MKTCSDCGTNSSNLLTICPECEGILEESQQTRIVWFCATVSLVVTFLMQKAGVEGRGLFTEAIMNAAALMVVVSIVWKIVQRLQDPERNPLRELVSFYSDRIGRTIVILVAVAVVLLELGALQFLEFAPSVELTPLRAVRVAVIFGFTAIYLPALIFFMRFGLIDLRRRNGLSDYEREKFGAQPTRAMEPTSDQP